MKMKISYITVPQKVLDIYLENWNTGEFLESLKSEKINKSLCVLQQMKI
jgi:hypothetical protein